MSDRQRSCSCLSATAEQFLYRDQNETEPVDEFLDLGSIISTHNGLSLHTRVWLNNGRGVFCTLYLHLQIQPWKQGWSSETVLALFASLWVMERPRWNIKPHTLSSLLSIKDLLRHELALLEHSMGSSYRRWKTVFDQSRPENAVSGQAVFFFCILHYRETKQRDTALPPLSGKWIMSANRNSWMW